MGNDLPQNRRMILLLMVLLIIGLVQPGTGSGHSLSDEVRLIILVRDAGGTPLPNVRVHMYLPQLPIKPGKVADIVTDKDGQAIVDQLDPDQTYVIQFHGAIPRIVEGVRVDSLPVQFQDDQNAGRELMSPVDPPGFPVHLGDQMTVTVRFVIGGTFTDTALAAAVPMFDLAARDDEPVRPVDSLSGQELTSDEARMYHATIGEPWGPARGPKPSPMNHSVPEIQRESITGITLPVNSPAQSDLSSASASSPPSLIVISVTCAVVVFLVSCLTLRRKRQV